MGKLTIILSLCFFLASCSNRGKQALNSPTQDETGPSGPSEVTLFLTSTGMAVASELIPLLPFEPAGRTVCYITTAAMGDEGVLQWTNHEIEALERTGFKVNRLDLSLLKPDDLEEAFSGCDLFWVGGGNTLYLLQEVRKSGFDSFVTEKISEGVPYVGTSAGSILLGPDVEFELYASRVPELTSYEGLNLFPFAPYVHFDDPDYKDIYEDILKFSLDHSLSFITLHDNQFIYMKGDKWQVIDVKK